MSNASCSRRSKWRSYLQQRDRSLQGHYEKPLEQGLVMQGSYWEPKQSTLLWMQRKWNCNRSPEWKGVLS
jgi:hypothetical protein